MRFHGSLADDELLGDLAARQPPRDESSDLAFANRQPTGIERVLRLALSGLACDAGRVHRQPEHHLAARTGAFGRCLLDTRFVPDSVEPPLMACAERGVESSAYAFAQRFTR